MLANSGIIEGTKSANNNSAMLVDKKDVKWGRLVVDFRHINEVCKPVGGLCTSPLAVIRMLAGAKIFSVLDCKNAFYSLLLAVKDRGHTSFTLPGVGRFQFTRMPWQRSNKQWLRHWERHYTTTWHSGRTTS